MNKHHPTGPGARSTNTPTLTHEGGSSVVNMNVTTSSWSSLEEGPLPPPSPRVSEI